MFVAWHWHGWCLFIHLHFSRLMINIYVIIIYSTLIIGRHFFLDMLVNLLLWQQNWTNGIDFIDGEYCRCYIFSHSIHPFRFASFQSFCYCELQLIFKILVWVGLNKMLMMLHTNTYRTQTKQPEMDEKLKTKKHILEIRQREYSHENS